jgi:hypothetical protein
VKEISLRNATREDWPAIEALHAAQQEKQGTNYELPYLFGQQMIPVVLVGTDETGKIHNCVYVEAVAEMRTIGCSSKATAFSQRAAEGLFFLLRGMGFRYCECFVPQKLKRYISKPLKRAGFADMAAELAYFSKDLREKR